MPKYCPTCGNSSDKVRFYGNFCEECTKRKFSEDLKGDAEIIRCKRCGRIKAHGIFVPPNGKNLADAIKQGFKHKDITLIDYSEDSALVDLSELTDNGTVNVEHTIKLSYQKVLCDVCYKKACNYHEATMQLRGNPDKIEKLMQRLTKYYEIHDQFISKIEEADGGLDVYLSSKSLANLFIMKHRLKPETSYTLAGVKQGKRVYKNTYALRF
jgi:NMD protein affecting ribosome stability and mRNA decay